MDYIWVPSFLVCSMISCSLIYCLSGDIWEAIRFKQPLTDEGMRNKCKDRVGFKTNDILANSEKDVLPLNFKNMRHQLHRYLLIIFHIYTSKWVQQHTSASIEVTFDQTTFHIQSAEGPAYTNQWILSVWRHKKQSKRKQIFLCAWTLHRIC